MIPRFEVFKDKNKKWRFKIVSKNGKVIAISKDYVSKRNVELGIKSIVSCTKEAIIFYKN